MALGSAGITSQRSARLYRGSAPKSNGSRNLGIERVATDAPRAVSSEAGHGTGTQLGGETPRQTITP
ncbi:unnamed protein product [Diplocarpon coronariae]